METRQGLIDSSKPLEQASDALFCIIVLVYNDLPHCLGAINSVLAQTERNFELVIVDNGSTDTTGLRIRAFLSDPRVRIVRYGFNQRSDATHSVAFGTSCKYLSFLFSDDLYDPERLAAAGQLFADNPKADYIFFNNRFVDDAGHPIPLEEVSRKTQFAGDISVYNRFEHLRYSLDYGSTLHPCGMIIRSSVYKELGGFPATMHRIGDMAFFARLLGKNDGIFRAEVMQTITVWRGGRNESHRNERQDNEITFERAVVLERWLEPAILDNLDKIFQFRQVRAPYLNSRSDKLWFLAQQVLKNVTPECQIFGFRLLHEASSGQDADFERRIVAATGMTPSQYIGWRLRTDRIYDFHPSRTIWFGGKLAVRVLRVMPARLVLEVGKFLSTLGFRQAGSELWDHAVERMPINRIKADT